MAEQARLRGQVSVPAVAVLGWGVSPWLRRVTVASSRGGDAFATVARPCGDEDKGGELDAKSPISAVSERMAISVSGWTAHAQRSQRWIRTLCTVRELTAHASSAGCKLAVPLSALAAHARRVPLRDGRARSPHPRSASSSAVCTNRELVVSPSALAARRVRTRSQQL
jgi:hypothetical protein